MKEQLDISVAPSFSHFVFREKARYLKIAIPALILQFVVFKWLYPYPDFISDSYSYIDTAALHLNVNLWPIGYSRYLAFIHFFTHSDTAVLAVQFTVLECSLLLFFYTFLYFYRPAANTGNILFALIFFNPLFIWLSNALLSDALFNALSILWWIQFIWMMHRPRLYQLFVLAALTGLAFVLRYTALYYPILGALAFAMSSHPLKWKLSGSLLPLVLMIPFVIFTRQETKKLTGTAEFSVFGGWQIANNALYMYDHIDVDTTRLPEGSLKLDRMVRRYFKRVPPEARVLEPFPGTYFIKVADAPLKMYSYPFYQEPGAVGMFKAWGAVSPLYNRYGNWLIRNHPVAFARYYCWLNVKNYFVPHLEKFRIYNFGSDSVWYGAVNWFDYKSPRIRSASSQVLPEIIFCAYPILFMMLNIFYIGMLIWLLIGKKWRRIPPFFMRCCWLLTGYLAINFAFSVLATPVVLRYQVMPYLLLFSYGLALLEFSDNPAAAASGSAPNPGTAVTHKEPAPSTSI